MLVIVGHGPSVFQRSLGPWLDTQTVVRLKWAEIPDPADWGSRTDYVCGSNPSFWTERERRKLPKLDAEFWWLGEPEKHKASPIGRRGSNTWFDYWAKFRTPESYPKPSTGLRAIFCAVEFLNPPEIGLLGFDMILHPDKPTSKWFHEPGQYLYSHDARAEHRAVMELGVKITEV
jgi:hypothetical protein